MEKRLKRVRDRAHSQFRKYMGLESALALRLWTISASKRLFLFLLLALLVLSCSKRSNRIDRLSPPDRASVSKTLTLQEALGELRNLKAPEGTDKELFNSLKAQLEKMLIARGAHKFPSAPPSADTRNVINLVTDLAGLNWNEARAGDWNNDGIVKADDIVPLAIHLGKGDDPDAPNYYKYAGYIDGDGDHIVGIGDVQAIAERFGESMIGYNIYEALDEAGLSSSKVATILRPSPPQDPDNPPWNISFATLQYDTSQGVIEVESAATKQEQVTRSGTGVPPVNDLGQDGQATMKLLGQDAQATWSPTPGRYYSVVPYGQGFDEQGEPVLVERFSLQSNWAYINIPPVAIFKTTPDTGEAPVTVTFDARDSYDADGYITNYVWDFDGDGLTDKVTQTPITTYEFTSPSVNPATLIIYDNTGQSSSLTSLPLHIAGFFWEIVTPDLPIAYKLVMLDGKPTIVIHDGHAFYLLEQDGISWIRRFLFTSEPPEGSFAVPIISDMVRLADGNLLLAYRGWDRLNRFASGRLGSSAWRQIVIDPHKSGALSFQQVPNTRLAVCYYDEEETNLKYAEWDGISIQTEYVDTELYAGRYSFSLDFDPSGNPAVAYRTTQETILKLATRRVGGWEVEIVNASPDGGLGASLFYLPNGTPYIIHYALFSQFWLSYKTVSGWNTVMLYGYDDIYSQLFVGNSAAMRQDGTIYLSFVENEAPGAAPGHLKLLRLRGTEWEILTADRDARPKNSPSVVIGEEGSPLIVVPVLEVQALAKGLYLVTRVE